MPESAQKGWRLFSILAAYFTCSDNLKPFLFKVMIMMMIVMMLMMIMF